MPHPVAENPAGSARRTGQHWTAGRPRSPAYRRDHRQRHRLRLDRPDRPAELQRGERPQRHHRPVTLDDCKGAYCHVLLPVRLSPGQRFTDGPACGASGSDMTSWKVTGGGTVLGHVAVDTPRKRDGLIFDVSRASTDRHTRHPLLIPPPRSLAGLERVVEQRQVRRHDLGHAADRNGPLRPRRRGPDPLHGQRSLPLVRPGQPDARPYRPTPECAVRRSGSDSSPHSGTCPPGGLPAAPAGPWYRRRRAAARPARERLHLHGHPYSVVPGDRQRSHAASRRRGCPVLGRTHLGWAQHALAPQRLRQPPGDERPTHLRPHSPRFGRACPSSCTGVRTRP